MSSALLDAIASHYGVRVSRGEVRMACPAHGGSNADSLKLTVSDDGQTLLAYCHSNECAWPEIRDAIERDTGLSLGGPRHRIPDPRSGGGADRRGCRTFRYRYQRDGAPDIIQVDQRWDGPCGRGGCDAEGPHKHTWREPAGVEDSSGYRILLHPPESAAPGLPPVVAEGEKSAAAAAEAGYPGFSYLGGASGAAKADYSPLAGRELVLIAPDNDAPGRRAALRSALELLRLNVGKVQVLDPALLPQFKGADLADLDLPARRGFLASRSGDSYDGVIRVLYELALLDYTRRVQALPESRLVPVEVSRNGVLLDFIRVVWDAVYASLCAPGAERLFNRGSELVEVEFRRGKILADGSQDNDTYVQEVNARRLGALSCEAVWWHKEKTSFKPLTSFAGDAQTDPNDVLDAARAALEAAQPLPYSWPGWKEGKKRLEFGLWHRESHWPSREGLDFLYASPPNALPPVQRVLHGPVLSPDGSRMLSSLGYHQEIAAWIAEDGAVDMGVLPAPDECLSRIWEVFGQFPFATEADRAHFLALLLAGIIGPSCAAKPAFLADKPAPGTGATLLMETAALLVGGVRPHRLTARGGREISSDAELEKSLVAAGLSGNPAVFLDNATGSLDSPVWNSYITSEVWQARRLHFNENASVDRTTIVDMVTGNNLLTTDESERRVVPLYLDAAVEDPSARAFSFDPKAKVLSNRTYYLEAVVGLVQHWLGGGRPAGPELRLWGGFERWRDLTSAVLHSAGVQGFGGESGRPSALRRSDDGTADFVRDWWEQHGSTPVKTRDLRELVADDAAVSSPQSFNARLKRLVNRIYRVADDTLVRVEAGERDHRNTQFFYLSAR